MGWGIGIGIGWANTNNGVNIYALISNFQTRIAADGGAFEA